MVSMDKKKTVQHKKKVVSKPKKKEEAPVVVQGNYIGKNFDPNFAKKFFVKSVKNSGPSSSSKELDKLGKLALLGGSIAGIIFLLDRAVAKKGKKPVDFVSSSVDTPLTSDNIGYKMLAKSGYKGGGRSPIRASAPNIETRGLGY